MGRGASANIIVTQPRRVAAMGVAARVAQERLEDVDVKPETVGYAIRGERRAGPETRLLFCTTGIVLRRLGTGDTDLSGVSHVIIDEAHERGVDTDLLICLVRDLLERNKTIKIILMSATINGKLLTKHQQANIRTDLYRLLWWLPVAQDSGLHISSRGPLPRRRGPAYQIPAHSVPIWSQTQRGPEGIHASRLRKAWPLE